MSWSLQALIRTKQGRPSRHDLAFQNMIPGILYGGGQTATCISVPIKELTQIAITAQSYKPGTLVIDKEEIPVMIKSLSCNNVKNTPEHIDLLDLRKARKFTLFLEIKPKGVASGVKQGGVLNIITPRLEVTVDSKIAQQLPEYIEIDVSEMHVGTVHHLSDLQLPQGTKATNPTRDNTILTIIAPSGVSEGADSTDSTTETPRA